MLILSLYSNAYLKSWITLPTPNNCSQHITTRSEPYFDFQANIRYYPLGWLHHSRKQLLKQADQAYRKLGFEGKTAILKSAKIEWKHEKTL